MIYRYRIEKELHAKEPFLIGKKSFEKNPKTLECHFFLYTVHLTYCESRCTSDSHNRRLGSPLSQHYVPVHTRHCIGDRRISEAP